MLSSQFIHCHRTLSMFCLYKIQQQQNMKYVNFVQMLQSLDLPASILHFQW